MKLSEDGKTLITNIFTYDVVDTVFRYKFSTQNDEIQCQEGLLCKNRSKSDDYRFWNKKDSLPVSIPSQEGEVYRNMFYLKEQDEDRVKTIIAKHLYPKTKNPEQRLIKQVEEFVAMKEALMEKIDLAETAEIITKEQAMEMRLSCLGKEALLPKEITVTLPKTELAYDNRISNGLYTKEISAMPWKDYDKLATCPKITVPRKMLQEFLGQEKDIEEWSKDYGLKDTENLIEFLHEKYPSFSVMNHSDIAKCATAFLEQFEKYKNDKENDRTSLKKFCETYMLSLEIVDKTAYIVRDDNEKTADNVYTSFSVEKLRNGEVGKDIIPEVVFVDEGQFLLDDDFKNGYHLPQDEVTKLSLIPMNEWKETLVFDGYKDLAEQLSIFLDPLRDNYTFPKMNETEIISCRLDKMPEYIRDYQEKQEEQEKMIEEYER